MTRHSIAVVVLLAVLVLPAGAKPESQDTWIRYSGHGMGFEYPATWELNDSPTGVVVSDNKTFALGLTMHNEGCYPLQQHPQLLDFMLKLYGRLMDGVPDGDPITQYVDTNIGPSSTATQIYRNPDQALMCGLQGYTAKNVTLAFSYVLWNPKDLSVNETVLRLSRLTKSLIVTLPDMAN